MLKMLMDPMGGIVMTNDGNAILREVRTVHVNWECLTIKSCPAQIQVQHPAAKSMIEISRTQDEEVGDGTTSVIILGERIMVGSVLLILIDALAGEMLSVAQPFLEQQMHPTVIISAYRQALEDIVNIAKDKIRSEGVDVNVSVCVSCSIFHTVSVSTSITKTK